MKRAVIYTRVSTASKDDAYVFIQKPEVQEQPLRDLIDQRGWNLYKVYSDRASGARSRRPGLDALMEDARRGEFEVVVVWRFDRFARSVKQLIDALEEFQQLGVGFVSQQEAIDTNTPMGKAMFTIIGAMAELERSIIRERVTAGIAHAQSNGTRSGNPIGRPRVVIDGVRVVELRDVDGLTWPAIGRQLHQSVGSIRRAYYVEKERARTCQKPSGVDE